MSCNTGTCACIEPLGDCPCVRASRGQKVEIFETQIPKELFTLLPDEDKNIINRLKFKALALSLSDKKR